MEQASRNDGASAELRIRQGSDGSFSLWSPSFGEGFHSGRGAMREARETFLVPSQLDRFIPRGRLRVVEVCVGTGTNLAMLLEGCAELGLELEWWGLELDPAPLQLALGQAQFCGQWQQQTLASLEALSVQGGWQNPMSRGQMLWGDARRTLPQLLERQRDEVDLVWHDAFSPQHCPQLWTVEFLGSLAGLLNEGGRWISYCSAAAVREGLRLANLNVVALTTPGDARLGNPEATCGAVTEGTKRALGRVETADRVERAERACGTDMAKEADGGKRADDDPGPGPGAPARRAWSGGTLASRAEIEPSTLWRALTTMELEHLASNAGEPYRDPSGTATASSIQDCRREAQAISLERGERDPSSAWRRRWGV